MDTYGQWPYFDGLQEWNLMFCIVSCPKPPCVFATVVSPIYNGRKLTCGLKIQRNDSFSPSKSFKPFAYRRANGYLFNWFAYTLKNSADWKNFEHCSAVNGWSGEDSLLQACVVNYKSSLMVFLIETVEFMPLKLEFPFDAEK